MVKMFRRSNGKLYLEYKAYGKIVQKSTRLIDTPKNRALIKKEVIPALKTKIISGDFQKEKPKGFLYYSQKYQNEKKHLKSYAQLKSRVKILNEYFKDTPIIQIKRQHIKDWIQDRLMINTPKTVKEYLTDLRGIFNIAIDFEHIKDNVVSNIKLPTHYKQEIEPFTPEEVIKLIRYSDDWFRLFLAISFYTGMRTGEVLGLMQSDINLKDRVISVKRSISKGKVTTPKTQKSIREVPIFDDLVPYLKKLPKSMWLFAKEDGTHLKSVSGNKLKVWRELLRECNLEYRKLYSTRHTFIVSMLKYSDLSILEIAQIVGHTNTQMIIQNYGKFIKGEHLKVDRGLKLFTDKSTDSKTKVT